MQMEYYISETNWSTILSFLSSQKGLHTKDIVKLRRFIEAVFFILKELNGSIFTKITVIVEPFINVISTGLTKVFGIV